ncbi:MAG: DUF975 family protein [Spirochaetaceae bacterium]|jgi:uncharacterized membrane protein|nr:DUF975 family protein [Spirochaetaceae bacterium]
MLKEVKVAGRNAFRANRSACIIVSLLSAFLITGFFSIQGTIDFSMTVLETVNKVFKLDKAQEVLDDIVLSIEKLSADTSIGEYSSTGVLHLVYQNAKIGRSLFYSFLHSLMDAIQQGSLAGFLIAGVLLALTLLFYAFIQGVLKVGSRRFFLKNLINKEPKALPVHAGVILFGFRRQKTKHLAFCALYKILRLIPWALSLVLLPVKLYAYRFYGYILALNPGMKAGEAIALSSKMMQGRKWQAFCLDISFFGWYLLGIFTLGLLNYFFVNPYRYSVWAAFFEKVKNEEAIVIAEDTTEESVHRPQIDWRRDYSAVNLVLLFFMFSCIGWLWECVYFFAQGQGLINRGTLYGPWLPIYGVGGVGTLIIFKRIREKPLDVFFLSMLICGILEYITATVLLYTKHLVYWNYNGFFFNIQGRTCLEGLLVFGAGCSAGIYIIGPVFDHNLNMIPLKWRKRALCLLALFFVIDLICSTIYPRSGAGITS